MMGSRHMPLPPLYWGRERGERQRYDTFPDRYGRPSDFYVGFEDLTLDGRGRTIVDVRTIDPRYLDTRVSPPGRAYQAHLESNFPRSDHRDREPRLRSAMSGRKSSISFGKGMKKLEKVLQKSDDFYHQFIQNFDNDMSSTANYATIEIQEKLWRLKIIGKKDKNAVRDIQNQRGDEEEDSEKPKKKFEEKKKDLTHALQVAMEVQFEKLKDTPRSRACVQSAVRLQAKIRTANSQIIDLLEVSTEDRDQCEALLNEIRLLKTLVDPESDQNKDLFKDDGERDGSSEAGEEEVRSRSGWD
jgi:hypothetical protein